MHPVRDIDAHHISLFSKTFFCWEFDLALRAENICSVFWIPHCMFYHWECTGHKWQRVSESGALGRERTTAHQIRTSTGHTSNIFCIGCCDLRLYPKYKHTSTRHPSHVGPAESTQEITVPLHHVSNHKKISRNNGFIESSVQLYTAYSVQLVHYFSFKHIHTFNLLITWSL